MTDTSARIARLIELLHTAGDLYPNDRDKRIAFINAELANNKNKESTNEKPIIE